MTSRGRVKSRKQSAAVGYRACLGHREPVGISMQLHECERHGAQTTPRQGYLSRTFIATGAAIDAFSALAHVFQSATKDILLIDPYMDEAALTKFAVAVPDGITLRLLADDKSFKPSLKPAAESWRKQYGAKHP